MRQLFADSPAMIRALIGFVLASAIAAGARRARSLSTSGALAAACVGTLCMAAGTGWGVLLIAYFLAASLLSRHGRREKARLTGGVVAKTGARDARQVFSNGGVYTACLVIAPLWPEHIAILLRAAALGALAASSADTWATEIGTLYGGTPRSLFTLRRVAPGTSGGVSAAGSLAMIAGAAFVALIAKVLSVPVAFGVAIVAGAAGAVADSVLGATAQERRWCSTCTTATEQRTHECGTPTDLRGGVSWMDNDTVNFLATLVGAAVAAILSSL